MPNIFGICLLVFHLMHKWKENRAFLLLSSKSKYTFRRFISVSNKRLTENRALFSIFTIVKTQFHVLHTHIFASQIYYYIFTFFLQRIETKELKTFICMLRSIWRIFSFFLQKANIAAIYVYLSVVVLLFFFLRNLFSQFQLSSFWLFYRYAGSNDKFYS